MTISLPLDIDPAAADAFHRAGWWRDTTIVDDFLANVAELPDKVAIVSDHADRAREQLTYAELGDAVDRIAAGLVELGIGAGDIVSFQLPNWWQFTALHLACARVGAATNAILPILRQREVAFILERTESKICVVAESFRGFDYAGMLLAVKEAVPTLERVFTVGSDSPHEGTDRFEDFFLGRTPDTGLAERLDALRPTGDHPGQLQFTSGTTGEPKGALHTFNTMWAGVRSVSEPIGLGREDTLLAFSPMAHTVGFYFGCSLPMMSGMTVVYQDAWDPARMLELVNTYGIAWTMAAPTFLADACDVADAQGIKTPSMQNISCAGAPVPPALIDRVKASFGATVLAAWGMTECGAVTTTRPGDTEHHIKHSDGRPPEWIELKVVDDDEVEVPCGQIGRLFARGASVAVTYFKRPDLFAKSLYDGWFDTQDLATQDAEGYIRLSGRTKDLVIRGAENIPVVEVEAALLTHPGVREIAIIGIADERLGERACAVIVPTDAAAPPRLTDLTGLLATLSMAKHFWPEHLKVVDQLPKTATGKIQKFQLREQSAEWAFDPITARHAATTGDAS